jgi:hypothetical protein
MTDITLTIPNLALPVFTAGCGLVAAYGLYRIVKWACDRLLW